MLGYFRLSKRLDNLEDELKKLKNDQQQLELEQMDVLERVKRLYARIIRRWQMIDQAEKAQEATETNDRAETLPQLPPGVDPISARILARRARLVPKVPEDTNR